MPEPNNEARDEDAIFATIQANYPAASEAEQFAMVHQLRHGLNSIPLHRRTALIGRIERSVAENLDWQDPEF